MEHDGIHELTAAYALDALDASDERVYAEHLADCARCREELARLSEAATALAYAVDPADPPPALRERILSAAREQQPSNVVPFRRPRQLRFVATSAAAALAAAVALAFGLWANSLSKDLDRERAVLDVLADPGARQVALTGAEGRLVVAETGRAALVVSGVARAPEGKKYELWVIDGGRPVPAGMFDTDGGRQVVPLTETVPEGAVVAVTLEREEGVDAPTGALLFRARA